jgi:hypothetical protein
MSQLGMCDKRQYEHNGPHEKIGEHDQRVPPFPCINWHAVIPADVSIDSIEVRWIPAAEVFFVDFGRVRFSASINAARLLADALREAVRQV